MGSNNKEKKDLLSWLLGWVPIDHPVSKASGVIFIVSIALYYASKNGINLTNLEQVLPYVIFVVLITPFFIFTNHIKELSKPLKDLFTFIFVIISFFFHLFFQIIARRISKAVGFSTIVNFFRSKERTYRSVCV